MALSRLDLVIVAAVAVGMLWIEHEHRINIKSPTAVELAGPGAPVCPDDDSIPFSADCIAFIHGAISPAAGARVSTVSDASIVPPDAQRRVELQAPACPANNENQPYSAK